MERGHGGGQGQLTKTGDPQQVLSPLAHRGREGEIHKGLHLGPVHQAQPCPVLWLHRV